MIAVLAVTAVFGTGLTTLAGASWAAPTVRVDTLNAFQKTNKYVGGTTIGLKGSSLNLVTRAVIGGIEVQIAQKRGASLQLSVPAFETARRVSVDLYQGGTKRNTQFINVPAATGTVVNSLNTWQLSNPYAGGSSISVTGVRLNTITRASIGGIDVKILAKRGTYLQVLVPAFQNAGSASLVLYQGGTRKSGQNIRIPARSGTYVNSLNTWQLSNRYDNGHGVSVTGVRLTAVTSVTVGGVEATITEKTNGLLRIDVPNISTGGARNLVFRVGSTILSTQPITVIAPTVAFIGDSYSTAAGASATAKSTSAIIAATMGWTVTNVAAGGTGYGQSLSAPVAQRACGKSYCPSYPEALASLTSAPDYIIVFGGRNQSEVDPAQVGASITAFYAQAKQRFPKATVVAVSPVWDASELPASMTTMRANVKGAAAANGYRYLDIGTPLAGRPDAVTEDLIHPNDRGHRLIADAFTTAFARG